MAINPKRAAFPVGVIVFLIRDGMLLLGKRTHVFGAGFWGLPGGHLEYGENVLDAGRRELAEETGLQAESLSFLNVVNQGRREDNHYLHIALLAERVQGEPENKEPEKCDGWEWFPLSALPNDLFPWHCASIDAFTQHKQFVDDQKVRHP